LCIFVCFLSKPTHLEVVSALTTAFLNALKRFMARGGRCVNLFSDTNFTGANNELQSFFRMVQGNRESVKRFLADQSVQWHFIPARSPYMSGFWKGAVRSANIHFKRVFGNNILTFEELITAFAQIKAILNSRSLCPVSNDPDNYEMLTPEHFLIGEPLNSFPEPNLIEILSNRLIRF